jgi:ABC-type uncharacterized transport system ATPase subunit
MAFLEMKHVSKYFGSVAANVDVNLSVEKGEIHALLGENGAGKSTLMNILYGMYAHSEGEIWLNGQPVRIKDPKDAIAKGIGMVHQHFMLIPALSVIENVVLGLKENKEVLDLKAAAREFSQMAERFGMELDPWAKVETLSVGAQQRVEILKALYRKASLLILDEPTAVLTPQEVKGLFHMLRQLTAEGLTIIFITHKLNEIMEVCDRCTILRLGRVVRTTAISDIQDKQELAALMVGSQVELLTQKPPAHPGDEVLRVEDLSYVDKRGIRALDQMSFSLRGGEILGVCGVDGNGQSELVRCITGLLKPASGSVRVCGADCTGADPRMILGQGVSHIPEDRHKMGMIREMTVNENLILMSYRTPECQKRGFLKWKDIRAHSQALCEQYNIKTPSVLERSGNLSGGNQQKMVVGRELDRRPRLLIAMHPDRGLDIGATKYIQRQIVAASQAGAGVLLVSTELDEILELSDRILVVFEGRMMGILDRSEATAERLGLMMAGARQSAG